MKIAAIIAAVWYAFRRSFLRMPFIELSASPSRDVYKRQVNDRFKLLQIALIQLGDHAGQMVELVDVLIFAQVVVKPQHISVKVGDEDLLVPHPVNADAL